jgi:hypothetical protein
VAILNKKEPTLGLTAIHSGNFLQRGSPDYQASLFFTAAEMYPATGNQIKLSRYGFFSTQKLYTSSILCYIYAILFLGS